MGRSELQKIIVPRNFMFGRVAFVKNNLNDLVSKNGKCLTKEEVTNIGKIIEKLNLLLINKDMNSEYLKQIHNKSSKENE